MSQLKYDKTGRLLFTREMKRTHKILIPNMLPMHFELMRNIFLNYGYDVDLLHTDNPNITAQGLQNVHNDACYPCLLVVGQFIDALKSGKYDPDRTALIITQTGGGCRASNYIHLLRKAMIKSGFENIPIISFNLSGFEKNGGFKITLSLVKKMVSALMYGDALMLISNQLRPYELVRGSVSKKTAEWIQILSEMYKNSDGFSIKKMRPVFEAMAADFNELQIVRTDKLKVGIVGEIYVKYSPLANNNLEEFLLKEDCEVVVPGVLDFVLFKADNRITDVDLYGGNPFKKFIINLFKNYLLKAQKTLIEVLRGYEKFTPPADFESIKKLAEPYIGYGNKMGEGWLLTAEMLELIHSGAENVVCAQPFGCLPNHIAGKGMIRKILKHNPGANIVAIDYDPGATKVNQENRIKLMLSTARDRKKKTASLKINAPSPTVTS
ncbi:MAG: 2-hydroxyacyl-CoA dehydratase [Oscillospiraceae bacterium]|nr:2-hydroxyacyl-CoA dehydratase [Oscillospiraceae bacterium]